VLLTELSDWCETASNSFSSTNSTSKSCRGTGSFVDDKFDNLLVIVLVMPSFKFKLSCFVYLLFNLSILLLVFTFTIYYLATYHPEVEFSVQNR